jgi:autotransporter-associated beta strand protein
MPQPLSKPPFRRVRRAILLAVAMAGPVVHATPPGAGWAMPWSDEFSGTAVDGGNWSIGTGARRDATNTASAVSVGGGALTVKTYTEGGKHYTGWLGSNGKFENCFGYWEARIRFNSAAGMWSAFWLQPYGINNVGDPAGNGTEIDIVEHRRQDSGGADMRNKSAMNIHWDGYGADHKSVGSTVTNPGVDATSLQGNYHTYGLLWEAGKYTLFLDGTAVWSTTAAVSNVRQWIYLTSEVDNGAWAGSIPAAGYGDRTTTTTQFDVDYVRFYQRDEQVINPGFTDRTGPWAGTGTTSWTATDGRSGGPGVRLNPPSTQDSSFEQTVHGLLPNTEYRLFGWGSVGSRVWPDIRIGVKNHGNPELYASIWSNGFTQAQVPFSTGAANTSARVYAWVPTQYGDCYADDLEVRRDAQINNAGFDNGETWPWYVYGDAFVHDWDTYQRSGGHALRFNGSATARGAEQTIYGLQPSTPYTLSCWVRTGSQPLRLGVKNHGLSETYATFTGTGNTWQRATHAFTTGTAATSATIYAFIPAGSNVSALDLDDFLLGSAIPAPWAAADVGAVGRTGDSTSRNGRLVLRGSGANVFDAADAFRFVYQPVAGDFALTARLDSFEAAQARAKAGIMLRASAAAGAAHAMIHWLPEGQVEFIWRPTDGATASYVWAAATTPWPPRLRLQRAGSVVTAFYSTDGTTWLQVGTPQVIALPAAPLGGPAVCAHDAADTAIAVFSNISFSGDRDGDGILDLYETNTGTYLSATATGTDPDNPDTDGDGFSDGAELANGTDPLVPNSELGWQTGATPGGTGTWDGITANWRVGATATAWRPGKAALFGGTAGTVTIAGSAAPATALTFNTGGYSLTGPGPLALADGAVIAANAGATTIACPLGAAAEITKAGAGTLTLTSPTLAMGTLACAAGIIDLNPALDATFAGVVTGAGAITKSGPNILTLAGPNTFGTAGGTFTFGSGTANVGALRLSHPQALGNHARIRLNSGQGGVSRLELAGGRIFPLHVDTVGRNTAAGYVALRNTTGANVLQGNFTIVDFGGAYYVEALAGSALTITGNLTTTLNNAAARDVRFTGAGDITLQGSLADSTTAVPTRLSVIKEGTGILRLTGSSSHSQPTTVNGGTLRLDGAFTAASVNVAAGGTLAGTGTLPAATIAGTLTHGIGEPPLTVTGTLALSGAKLALTGAATAAVHVLVNRGTLIGSFATLTGVPTGYVIDPAYLGTAVALVRKATADFEIWAVAHGLDPVGNGAAARDPDADGLTNAIEFVLDLDPSTADLTSAKLPRAELVGPGFVITFTRVKAAAANGFLSELQWSSELTSAPWIPATPAQTAIVDHGATETVTVTLPPPAGGSRLFARLKVTGP